MATAGAAAATPVATRVRLALVVADAAGAGGAAVVVAVVDAGVVAAGVDDSVAGCIPGLWPFPTSIPLER